jgi:hypothetical protein
VINRSRRDLGIAVAASGGLSHFVVDETLDRKVLDAISGRMLPPSEGSPATN